MRKKDRQRLDRSCAWIRDHWNAANLDVPDELLFEWMYDPGDEGAEPSGFHLAVFTFGLLQHDLISNHVPEGVKRCFAQSEILRLFDVWQLKLALAEVHRNTEVKVKPVPLFAFPEDERVETWATPPADSTPDVRR